MDAAVVIPCHNGSAWIERALWSVRVQTLTPTQVIVVDDASTDDSVSVVGEFDMDVELIHVDYHNAAAARNAGIRAASAEWVAFLDADDEWYPHHLAAVAMADAEGDDAYLCACDRRYAGTAEIESFEGWPPPWPQKFESGLGHLDFLEYFHSVSSFAHSGVAVRRKRSMAVGGFDESLVRRHDYEHIMRVIDGRTWTFDPTPGVIYQRDTPYSISRNVVDCEYDYMQGVVNNIASYDGPSYRNWVRDRGKAAIRSAVLFGNRTEQRRAYFLAKKFLPTWQSWMIGMLMRVPSLFRVSLQLREAQKTGQSSRLSSQR